MSRILLKTYDEVVRDPEKFKMQEEIYNSLTETEKTLAKTMLLVNIIGAFKCWSLIVEFQTFNRT